MMMEPPFLFSVKTNLLDKRSPSYGVTQEIFVPWTGRGARKVHSIIRFVCDNRMKDARDFLHELKSGRRVVRGLRCTCASCRTSSRACSVPIESKPRSCVLF